MNAWRVTASSCIVQGVWLLWFRSQLGYDIFIAQRNQCRRMVPSICPGLNVSWTTAKRIVIVYYTATLPHSALSFGAKSQKWCMIRHHHYFMSFPQHVKDRQQEVRAVLVASRYIGDYHMPLKVLFMYHIPLYTLIYGLFIDIKHVKIT